MCGRFLLTSPPEAVGAQFELAIRENFPPRYNIAPTQPIAVIRKGVNGKREFALARWGFIPARSAPDRMRGKPLINARSETVAVAPVFRNAFRRRRCLVPADGFYEWRTEGSGRQPYLIEPAAGGLVALAGVWETAHDSDGGEIDTAAILTTDAGADVRPLHAREPAIIAQDNYARWLDLDERRVDEARALVASPLEGFWRLRKVSRAVNDARNEGEALLRETGQGELF